MQQIVRCILQLEAAYTLLQLSSALCCVVPAAQVPLNEYDFPQSKLASVQAQLERLVEKNYYLHQSARDAYRWVYVGVGVSHSAPSVVVLSCDVDRAGLYAAGRGW